MSTGPPSFLLMLDMKLCCESCFCSMLWSNRLMYFEWQWSSLPPPWLPIVPSKTWFTLLPGKLWWISSPLPYDILSKPVGNGLCVLTSFDMQCLLNLLALFWFSPPELMLLVMVWKIWALVFLNLPELRGLVPPGVMGDYLLKELFGWASSPCSINPMWRWPSLLQHWPSTLAKFWFFSFSSVSGIS